MFQGHFFYQNLVSLRVTPKKTFLFLSVNSKHTYFKCNISGDLPSENQLPMFQFFTWYDDYLFNRHKFLIIFEILLPVNLRWLLDFPFLKD